MLLLFSLELVALAQIVFLLLQVLAEVQELVPVIELWQYLLHFVELALSHKEVYSSSYYCNCSKNIQHYVYNTNPLFLFFNCSFFCNWFYFLFFRFCILFLVGFSINLLFRLFSLRSWFRFFSWFRLWLWFFSGFWFWFWFWFWLRLRLRLWFFSRFWSRYLG